MASFHDDMITLLRSIWVWTAIALLVLSALPAMALVRLFDRDPAHYATGRAFRWFGQLATRINPLWNVEISGEQITDPRRPYVVVSNHQSNADIPVISRLPWEMKWVVKKELFGVPVFGWLLKLAGDIPVDRRDRKSRANVLDIAAEYLQNRCSVMFFPEGTRSRDGRVIRFTDGAFRLAIQEGVPILPLVVEGTFDALPKHDWRFRHPSDIRLRVLPPVSTDVLTSDDVPALRDQVRRDIIEQLAEWRELSPTETDALAPARENVPEKGTPPS